MSDLKTGPAVEAAAAWQPAACCRAVAICSAALLLLACEQRPAASADGKSLDSIVAQCAEDMVRQTCRVMGSTAVASAAQDAVVFVAGVGAIDAKVYNRLREDGQAMCETVRKSCLDAWDGPACKTARALYPAP
jgi:hypothetical protein